MWITRVLLCAACGLAALHWRSRLRTDRNSNGWSGQARRSSASRCALGLFWARRTVNRTTRWPRPSRRRVRPCWIGGSALPKAGYKLCMSDRPRGRSFAPLTRAKEAEILATTQRAPTHATHWSCRSMATVCGVSKASVQRVWHAHGFKPHLIKTFKLSNDPHFVEKLEDVVGLYLNPPEHALVLVPRRKEPDSGLGSHPARPADEERTLRHDDARLQAPRHHHAVCRT